MDINHTTTQTNKRQTQSIKNRADNSSHGECTHMKPLLSAFLIAVMIGGFTLAGTTHFGTVQAATDFIGIITSDTTWTKANSPYDLTGPLLVDDVITLTIEPGITVNLNDYYIQVNGTLIARGSNTNPIHFSTGRITFSQSSSSWNEQTDSGCIVENAGLTSTEMLIINSSPKINSNTINGNWMFKKAHP
jgi:hypothetical protein